MKLCFAFVLLTVLAAAFHAAESACADAQDTRYCVYWKKLGYCNPGHTYRSYMEGSCKRTCSFCQGCTSKPCANGGTCSDTGGDSFICSCVLGFQGKTCSEVNACARKPCKNGGICTKNRSSFKCRCANGYSGNTCETAPKPTKKCKNSGRYDDARCKGWSGFCKKTSKWYGFMKDHCSETCGFCKKEGPQCGKGPNKAATFRVVGGDEAIPHSWPWQAFIGIKTSSRTSACGGTLIAKRWVMTAGHCLTKRKGVEARHLEVVLGEHNRNKIENTEQYRSVLRIVRHPNYNYDTKDNDIALLELNREVVLNDNVGLACLPTEPPEPGNSNCYITGFGKTDGFSLDSSVTLQEVQLPVVTNKKCFGVNNDVPVTENMLCAGTHLDVNLRASGCKGDSGGPFVCMKNNVWSVQGVVSWGSNTCVSFERYTVFARVTRYLDWIKKTIS